MTKACFSFILLSLISFPSYGQNILVTSHYPSSAFITERLLLFSIDRAAGLRIRSIVLFGANNNCVSLVDPFYPHTFHIYCYNPATFNLSVEVLDAQSRAFTLAVGAIQVRELVREGSAASVNFNPSSAKVKQ